jgi:hypothetical protein
LILIQENQSLVVVKVLKNIVQDNCNGGKETSVKNQAQYNMGKWELSTARSRMRGVIGCKASERRQKDGECLGD